MAADPNESSADEFAAAVGRAIISWQHVERECAVLFHYLLRAGNGMGAIGAFYHIKNFSTRVELLAIAARFFLFGVKPHESADAWLSIHKRLLTANALRNRIAHSEVSEEMTETSWKFQLGPHTFDWSQMPIGDGDKLRKWAAGRNARILAFQDIKLAEVAFDALANDIGKLNQSLSGLSEPEL